MGAVLPVSTILGQQSLQIRPHHLCALLEHYVSSFLENNGPALFLNWFIKFHFYQFVIHTSPEDEELLFLLHCK
jgi:hypothetical protein